MKSNNLKGVKLDIYLQAILKYCILPFFETELYSGSFDYYKHLSDFFCIDEREIYFAKTLSPFKLPGTLVGSTNKITAKWGYRDISKGYKLAIRVDIKNPDVVEIEQWPKVDLEQVFRLTRSEWDSIKKNICVIYKLRSDLSDREIKNLLQYHADFVKLHLDCEFRVKVISNE
jgi:hypothetical protein